MRILVTGAAGFIGSHTAARLLDRGDEVIGLDNLSPYYDVSLKEARLGRLKERNGFSFIKADLADRKTIENVFGEERPQRVVHLAAQAGVRYSLDHPHAYIDANITGTLHILEGCRHNGVEHLVYASSSSVYGANRKLPFSVSDSVDHPVSLYAATKKANELMAHVYSHLHALAATGLRYFTVYGPWGRPDMSPVLFARAIMEGRPIQVFNRGDMQRDFTYVDDIVEGTLRVLDEPPRGSPPYAIYNIGNHRPVPLLDYIAALERALGRTAKKELLPMQAGDAKATYADTRRLAEAVGFAPSTPLEAGLAEFAQWLRSYYGHG